jgi:hypothetical protein
MGSHLFRLGSDTLGFLGLASLAVATYFLSGMRSALPWHDDLYQSAPWGRFFAGAVYAGLSVMFFWILLGGFHAAG